MKDNTKTSTAERDQEIIELKAQIVELKANLASMKTTTVSTTTAQVPLVKKPSIKREFDDYEETIELKEVETQTPHSLLVI